MILFHSYKCLIKVIITQFISYIKQIVVFFHFF